MDALGDQVDDLSLSAPAAPQLNLAAIFVGSLEATESDASTAAALLSLWEVLTEGCEADERTSRMASTFAGSSLELLPALSPLLNRPDQVAQLAQKIILEGLGGYASPREILLAVGEQVEDLLEVERALANDGRALADDDASTSSDEDEDDNVPAHGSAAQDGAQPPPGEASEASYSDDESETDQDDGVPTPLDAQLPTLVRLLTLRLPLMKGRKALPTILHLSSMLRPAVSRFASHRPSVGLCRELALAVTRLVAAAHAWAQSGKDDWSVKGEQTPLLLSMLADTVVRLRPGLNLKSLERASILQDTPPAMTRSIGAKSLPGLGDWPEGMLEIETTANRLLPDATGQPSKALPLMTSEKLAGFALVLLSHAPPSLPPTEAQATLVTLVGRVLSRENASAAANFLWSLLKALPPASGPDELYDATVAQIWTVFVPLLAADPDPQTRKALFSLLSTSIAPRLLPPLSALDLLFPLPSPFLDSPLLRPAGLHFLRGLVAAPGSLGWLKGAGLARLEAEAFSLPFVQDESLEAWDADEDPSGETWIRGPGPIAVVLALNIYALLLTRDTKDESGIQQPETVQRQAARWIAPLRQALDARPRSAGSSSTPSGQTSHSHSHAHRCSHSHSHTAPTPTTVADEEDENEEDEGESDAAWETVAFALEGVERALSSLS